MIRFVLSFLLLSSFVIAQEKSSVPVKPAPAGAGPTTSAPEPAGAGKSSNEVVITINGICSPTTATMKTSAASTATHKSASAGCKTVVTRAEFEQLADVLQVPPVSASRKQLANQYGMQLVIANTARKRGLDHGVRYEQLLKLARMQVLTNQLAHILQEESAKISEKDIADYYNKTKAEYDEATLERLYIPRALQQDPPKETLSEADMKKRQEDSAAAMKKEADDLRARSAAGEDFAKLQAEAYKFANFKASPPEVKMEKARRTTLPPAQAAVLEMKPGEVSQVFTDSSGYFVYKLDQKDTVPLDRVHDEIKSSLQKQRMQEATQAIQQSATPVLNESYFAQASPAPASVPPMGMPGTRPPATAPATGPK
jgi:parvulin-like peptidyl-prolyl isomerase